MHDRTALRPWLALAVLLAGTFVVTLDFFIVAVAIPSIQASFAASDAAMQWAIAGYGLTFAVGLITCGRLGDMLGRRRMFGVGISIFTAASLACAGAPSIDAFLAARVAQGVGGAVAVPQVMSMLNTLYTGETRTKAFAWYALTLGLAATSGQLLGGALIAGDWLSLGWRWCFLINLPIGLGALACLRNVVPAVTPHSVVRVDPVATAMLTTGLLGLLWPLIEGRQSDGSGSAWLSAGLAAALLGGLILHQRAQVRHGRGTLVPLELLHDRRFVRALAAALVFYSTNASFYFVLALYTQMGRGLSPVASGLVFSALAFGFFGASLLAPKLMRRSGVVILRLGGIALALGHLLQWLLVTLADAPVALAPVVALLLLQGAGIGFIMAPLAALTLSYAPPQHAGVASGVLGTTQWIGNSLGVALIGIPFFGALERGGDPALVHQQAFAAGLLYLMVVTVIFLGLVLRGLRERRPAPAAGHAAKTAAARDVGISNGTPAS
ncbi:MAG TPA: MFS transporter [Burkholderiales bacterium]